jgi:fibronectin-binding autotransporter adhesin
MGLQVLTLATTGVSHAAFYATGDYTPAFNSQAPWLHLDSLSIGITEEGTLSITDGSYATIQTADLYGVQLGIEPGSVATVNVIGEDSALTSLSYANIGNRGQATLNIIDGAAVSTGRTYVGNESKATAFVNVTGPESTWTTRDLLIGEKGIATVEIENGGIISSTFGRLGSEPYSAGNVSVRDANSRWTLSGDLLVGRIGIGTLRVESGGNVSNRNGTINPGSEGTVIGVDSQWVNTGDLIVGQSGEASLNILDGGLVTVAGGTRIGEGRPALDFPPFGTLPGVPPIAPSQITFRNGTLNTGGLWASSNSLEGVGVINTDTIVGDENLTFNSEDDSQNLVRYDSLPGQNITINIEPSNPSNTAPLGVGIKNAASLRIADGRIVASGDGYLGYESGSLGSASVSGAETIWKNSKTLYVGRNGHGEMEILNGAAVESNSTFIASGDGSVGNVCLRDLGSKFTTLHLEVGKRGQGSLRVENGATLNSDVSVIGYYAESDVTVTGPGSNWNVSNDVFFIGRNIYSLGKLYVKQGATVSSNYGFIGRFANSEGLAVVCGASSKWQLSRHIYIGAEGEGTLEIVDGGRVSSGVGYIGDDSTGIGSVVVTGAGSTWDTLGGLYVGRRGDGILRIEDQGIVRTDSGKIAWHSSSTGEAYVNGLGAAWHNIGDLIIGLDGDATLSIKNRGVVTVSGILSIDVDSDNDSYINMATGGLLALKGDADDSLSQFLGLINGTDAIRYWNAWLASWAPLTTATYGTDYTLEYLTTGQLTGYTALTVLTPEPPGDFDGDGDIDGRDFLAWQRNPSVGDLADWRANYGTGSLSAVTAVPEPNSFALFLLTTFSLAVTRKPMLKSIRVH